MFQEQRHRNVLKTSDKNKNYVSSPPPPIQTVIYVHVYDSLALALDVNKQLLREGNDLPTAPVSQHIRSASMTRPSPLNTTSPL